MDDLVRTKDQTQTPPLADLPASYTDHVPIRDGEPVPFEMVLIPGDPNAGIKPFYIAKTEVTWAMFMQWMWGMDLADQSAEVYAQQIQDGLRPSPLGHGHPTTDLGLVGEPEWPAVGMSWRVAQAYCRWLSEQTGRTYRLPIDQEWRYVLERGGGVPANNQSLLDRAVLSENAEKDEITLINMPRAVGRGEPDALGLYDVLGNAAEWVQPMGGKRWVRGGHFMLETEALTADWMAYEDQRQWNASYPQHPPSDSWYIDHFYQGIRLVGAIDVPIEQIRESAKTNTKP